MSATNKTTNYDLPIFVGTDKPSWLGDWNSAMTAIDTAIAGAKSTGDSATTVAGQAKSTAEAASETATAASETAAAASEAANNATTIAINANTQAGDAKTDAHAALEMATELQEKFAGNRSSSILQIYPGLVPTTDYGGLIVCIGSNYNLAVRGYFYLTQTGWNKVTKIIHNNGVHFLIGIVSGNPYGLTPAADLSGSTVFLGATLGYQHRTSGDTWNLTTHSIYMFYNSSTQRTEIYMYSGLNSDNLNNFPSTVDQIRLFTNVTYNDNDIEIGSVEN